MTKWFARPCESIAFYGCLDALPLSAEGGRSVHVAPLQTCNHSSTRSQSVGIATIKQSLQLRDGLLDHAKASRSTCACAPYPCPPKADVLYTRDACKHATTATRVVNQRASPLANRACNEEMECWTTRKHCFCVSLYMPLRRRKKRGAEHIVRA